MLLKCIEPIMKENLLLAKDIGTLTITLHALFLILEKRPVILLYWFAAMQQTSTLKRQKYA